MDDSEENIPELDIDDDGNEIEQSEDQLAEEENSSPRKCCVFFGAYGL